MNLDKDREVETRPPLDTAKLLAEQLDEMAQMANFRIPTQAEADAIMSVVAAGEVLIEKIIAAVPEGTEQIVAINNVKAAALWVRHGVMRRGVTFPPAA